MNEREVPGHISAFINAALRPFAWFCIMALMAASWTPGQEMIRTGFNPRIEHVFAYLLATIAVSLAYQRVRFLSLACAMIAYAALLEVGQLLVPERHAGMLDWVAGSTGVICGCGGVVLWRWRRAQ
jgi:VanZ family protein